MAAKKSDLELDLMYAGHLSMQKIGNFEPSVQCLTTIEENSIELTNQVVF